ncbi:LOW QUALITY PROTEIN: otogelin [Pelodytes ibericus]
MASRQTPDEDDASEIDDTVPPSSPQTNPTAESNSFQAASFELCMPSDNTAGIPTLPPKRFLDTVGGLLIRSRYQYPTQGPKKKPGERPTYKLTFSAVSTTNPFSSASNTSDSRNNSSEILQKEDPTSQSNQEIAASVYQFQPTFISPVERKISKVKCESLPCFNGGECIQRKFCDCRRYNASGSRCQIVYNTGADRDSICRTWGQYHFETFDGVYYSFPGKFTYDLLRQNDPDEQSFSIQVHNDADCNSFPYSCKRSFSLYFSGDGELKLESHKVLHNNLRIQPPYSVGSLQIQKTAEYVIIRRQYVFTLAWDGSSSIYIKMSPDYLGKTNGLCGNNNGVLADDLVTSYGKQTEDIEEFVNSWSENIPHEASVPGTTISSYDPPCPKQSQHVNLMAHSLCSLLLQSPFQSCHELVSPSPFMAGCANDLCVSEGDVATWCRALTEYARACAQAGHPLLEWRAVHKQCEVSCESDLVYSECITCCPSSCQQKKSCIDSEIACVDGCYCPEGLIFENGVCVQPSECPCEFHGTTYHAGSVVQDQCNNCTCTSGRWICTDAVCPAECSVTGDIHIITFDGRKYTFQAPCQYILAKSVASGMFTITVQNSRCGQNQDGSCIQSINIILNQDPRKQLTLTHSGDILLLEQYKINLPYTDDAFEVRKLSSEFVQVKTHLGLQLLYDSSGLRLYLQLDGRWKEDTIGLCGTFNGNTEDDFLSPVGVPESTSQLFGNSWKISSACSSDLFPSSLDPCDVHLQSASYASESCSILTKDLFAPCHPYLSPVSYYEQCRRDTCKCGQACLCSALAHYAHQCRRFGITIDFRASITDCVIPCKDTLEYGVCVSSCGQTCQSLSLPEQCGGDCVEGCACPRGKFLDTRSERCVERKECPCYFQGIDYPPGEKIITSFGKCHCNDGSMNCESYSMVYDCPPGQIYYNCSNPEEDIELSQERTCENQLLNLTATSAHLPCVSGCVCPKGLVKHGDECFEPDLCPCSWKAKEYYPGDMVNSSCHTCVCQHGAFQCTFHPCPSMCTTYGDRHYRTFDGLAFDFVGACKVHLVKGLLPSSLSVTVENVNCYSGIICRKKLSISLGQSLIKFDDDTGNLSPSSVIDRRNPPHIWQAGFFTFVHFPSEFITLLWDQRTTIHIQVGPQWQGELNGLCGNFDLKTINEMRTPDNFDLMNSQEFGNSWATAECADSSDIRNPCTVNPLREPFAKKECGILLSDVFEACHPVVDVTWFYSNCLSDTCGCSRGGDCECFCTSVSAYAHQCCQQGVSVDWRTPRVCPYDCEFFNKVVGKGPYKLTSFLDRSLVLAARVSDGSIFPMRGDYLISGESASFMLTPGLYKPKAHDRNLVSLELANRPNYFLNFVRNGTLSISKWQRSAEFQSRSTFIIHRNTWIPGYNALECFTKPGYFIRISASYIYLTRYHNSPTFRRSTLFRLADSKINLSPGSTCEWKYDSCSSACFRTCRDPGGEHCKEVPKIEGCFPTCSPHMVLDEVTRKCVFLEDCIEPPILLSTTSSPERHTFPAAYNMTSPPSPPFTSVSQAKLDITVPEVSKWADISTVHPGFITSVVPQILTNASTPAHLPAGTLHPSAEMATSPDEVSSVLFVGVRTSSQAPLVDSGSTSHVGRITDMKTDMASLPSPASTVTTAGISERTQTPSIVATERSQLPTGTVTSPEPAVLPLTPETEAVPTRDIGSSPLTESTTIRETLVTMLPIMTVPFVSQFSTAMLTSKSTTVTPSVETEIRTVLPKEVHTAETTEYLKTLYTTPAASSTQPSTESITKKVFRTAGISTVRVESQETTAEKEAEVFSHITTTRPYSSSSSPALEERLSAPTVISTKTGELTQTLPTESTAFTEVIRTAPSTTLLVTEQVSLKTNTTLPFSTKVSPTQSPTGLTERPTNFTEITFPGTSSPLLNATIPLLTSEQALPQTLITTVFETEMITNMSTAALPTFSLRSVRPSPDKASREHLTKSTTSPYLSVSDTSTQTATTESVTKVAPVTSHFPLLTIKTKIEPTKTTTHTLSGVTTAKFSLLTAPGQVLHLTTEPGTYMSKETTSLTSKLITPRATTMVSYTGTTLSPYLQTISEAATTKTTTVESKSPKIPITSPHVLNATETATYIVSTKYPVITEGKETLAYTTIVHELSNVTGSLKSIPQTGRTLLPTDFSAHETFPSTSPEAVSPPTSPRPSTTYSTTNVTKPFLSTTIVFPSIKTSIFMTRPTSPSPGIIRATHSTTQRTSSPFTTSLPTAHPDVSSSVMAPLTMDATSGEKTLSTETVTLTHHPSLASTSRTTPTPVGQLTPMSASPGTKSTPGAKTTVLEGKTGKHLPSTERVETLFMSTKHTTGLKDLSSAEIYKTTGQLISSPSTQPEDISETLATYQPTPTESTSAVSITEETLTPEITITGYTVTGAPKTTFLSTTEYSPLAGTTSQAASSPVSLKTSTDYMFKSTSLSVTTGLTPVISQVPKTLGETTTEKALTTELKMANYSTGETEGPTTKLLEIVTPQTPMHTPFIVNATDELVTETTSTTFISSTQSPHKDTKHTSSLVTSIQPLVPTSQEPEIEAPTVTPSIMLTTPGPLNATVTPLGISTTLAIPNATVTPSQIPTISFPTNATVIPSLIPTISFPTNATVIPSQIPTISFPTNATVTPSQIPTISFPTNATVIPSLIPTISFPTNATVIPSQIPTISIPTNATVIPSQIPTTSVPTNATVIPSQIPPISVPTNATVTPSQIPTISVPANATVIPSQIPTISVPTNATVIPSQIPPISVPTNATVIPSQIPTISIPTNATVIPSQIPIISVPTNATVIPSQIPIISAPTNATVTPSEVAEVSGLPNATETPSEISTISLPTNATTVSPVTESASSATKLPQETVTGYSADQTKTEEITEGISASAMVPSRESATIQACMPYTENDCIKHICVDGQLIQVNKSQHCPYNATQPSCGLLGSAVQINGDKCCPKWECACRCSVFSDLSFVTFDGRYLALFKEASYIFSLTEDESITAQVSKCRPTNGVRIWNEFSLCLSVLELTHLSNQIIIDRLNRKVAVNSRYAWPMVRKYGYKIVDTGNMYLIETPTNVKIQWFHSTGLMIIETNATSKPTSMGLCGLCDGNATNDLILPNGKVLGKTDDSAEFLDNWQVAYTLKYVGKERHQDVNCSVTDCAECFAMILHQTFSSCHPYVSPDAFCELWVQDTEYIEDDCKALTAYTSMCHKFNICIEWRTPDYCPFQCPETLRYQPCLPVCDVPRTCQNNEIDLHDTESCSALTEGCVCAPGSVLHRSYATLCIPEAKCACTDSSGIPRAVGEVWTTSLSGCCMHKCIDNETIIPVEYNCSDVQEPQCLRYGEVTVSISENGTCCPRKACVCNQTACDSQIPECSAREKLSSYYQENSCCPNYTCECDPDKCEPAEPIDHCREDQTLYVAQLNNSCCVTTVCGQRSKSGAIAMATHEIIADSVQTLNAGETRLPLTKLVASDALLYPMGGFEQLIPKKIIRNTPEKKPETPIACNLCSNHLPECREGEILTVDGNFTDKCCPVYQCVCDTSRCPEVTCDLGMSPVEIWSPESCCPLKTCECSCADIQKPECRVGEKLEVDEELMTTPANVCNCTVYKCVIDTVCLIKDRGVLRPGQTIVEHTANGICHSTHCTSLMDPVTKYHKINITSLNCASKCEPNQVYVPPRDLSRCCGTCRNTSCVQTLLNGTLLTHRPGTSWNSKCVKYDCTNTSVGPVLITSAINCPPFNETECIKMGGYALSFLDGCCKTCEPTFPTVSKIYSLPSTPRIFPNTYKCFLGKEDGKFCKRVTVRMTIRKNDCRSNTPVNIVSCDGKCPSASIYNYNINTYARFCKCCRELGLQRRTVQLYCSGNSTWVNYSIQEPTECSCQWS